MSKASNIYIYIVLYNYNCLKTGSWQERVFFYFTTRENKTKSHTQINDKTKPKLRLNKLIP